MIKVAQQVTCWTDLHSAYICQLRPSPGIKNVSVMWCPTSSFLLACFHDVPMLWCSLEHMSFFCLQSKEYCLHMGSETMRYKDCDAQNAKHTLQVFTFNFLLWRSPCIISEPYTKKYINVLIKVNFSLRFLHFHEKIIFSLILTMK